MIYIGHWTNDEMENVLYNIIVDVIMDKTNKVREQKKILNK